MEISEKERKFREVIVIVDEDDEEEDIIPEYIVFGKVGIAFDGTNFITSRYKNDKWPRPLIKGRMKHSFKRRLMEFKDKEETMDNIGKFNGIFKSFLSQSPRKITMKRDYD